VSFSPEFHLLAPALDPAQWVPHFQPIVSLRTGEIIGHESLLRGADGSGFSSAEEIFAWADGNFVREDVEILAQELAIERFAGAAPDGRLFLNVSPASLEAGHRSRLLDKLGQHGVQPKRIVIELTENAPTVDFEKTRDTLLHYRSLGFDIAIDDLGDGFASLRMWSELRPDYVKIDIHFVQGVSHNSLKLEFVKAVQQLAACCHAKVIAEGVEDARDLRVLRDLGVGFAQGYLIGRPAAAPAQGVPPEVRDALSLRAVTVWPAANTLPNWRQSARKLLIPVEPVTPDTPNEAVQERFERDGELVSLPVVRDGVPVGLISRYTLVDRFARPFRRELFGKRPCEMFMNPKPLVVDAATAIEDVAARLGEIESWYLAEGFVLTDGGKYIGIGSGQDLVREITRLQMAAARYANPLTMLPGNVPIVQHVEQLLAARVPFSACYCDLDNFKPFNDSFGYPRGDDLIRLVAHSLSTTCDAERDFIGHIGGDDFMVLMQSEDWTQRLHGALAHFAEGLVPLLPEEVRANIGYRCEDRRGESTFFPVPTLSIGAIEVAPDSGVTHLEVASAATDAKKQAKKEPGNTLFVERRRIAAP
jgi:diguanylate cyclase (GGDEF)-like protein